MTDSDATPATAAEEKGAAASEAAEAADAKAADASSSDETDEKPAKKGKPTVITEKRLGIDAYLCSEGDYTTLTDEADVKRHIRSTH